MPWSEKPETSLDRVLSTLRQRREKSGGDDAADDEEDQPGLLRCGTVPCAHCPTRTFGNGGVRLMVRDGSYSHG